MAEVSKVPAVKSKKDIQVKPVVKSPAKLKKKGKFANFVEKFFVEDIRSVLKWGVSEVMIPALKKLLVEFVDSTANTMVYGHGSASPTRRVSSVGNISYREYWARPRDRGESYEENRVASDIYSYGTVLAPSKEAAKDALDQMNSIIRTYGFVTVGHFLEMMRIQPRSTDFNYGWTSIAGAEYIRVPSGEYEIRLPRVMQID